MTSSPLRGLVEVLIEDQRELRREIRSDFRELRVEIESLKNDRAKGKGWIAGALAVVSLIISVAATLHGCSTTQLPVVASAPPELPIGQWALRPAFVFLDPLMPAACRDAAQQALSFWASQSVGYLVPMSADTGWLGFQGLPPAGTISIMHASLPGNVAGETLVSRYSGCVECIRSAEIWVDMCTVEVMAHEIGHALGLGHMGEAGNLMYPVSTKGAFGLNPEQKDWVR